FPYSGNLRFSRDGKELITVGWGAGIQRFEVPTGKPITTPQSPPADGKAWLPRLSAVLDGRVVIVESRDQDIQMREATTGKGLFTLKKIGQPYPPTALSLKGDALAVGYKDGTIRLWSVPEGKEQPQLSVGSGAISALAFSPDGKVIVG